MKTLRPITSSLLQSSIRTRPSPHQHRITAITSTNHERHTPYRRTFLASAFDSPVQEISATRIIRTNHEVVYDVISNVEAYSQFIPYCQSSVVTKRSDKAADGNTYPEEAKLSVGFNDNVSEEFWSRVYCVPLSTVEAVSGSSDTSLPAEDIKHHSPRPPSDQDPTRNSSVLSLLSTRWTLRPYHYKPPPTSALDKDTTHNNHKETSPLPGQERTEVHLVVKFKFANPVYAALSQAAAPKVAEKMIDAFEKRLKALKDGDVEG